MSRVYFLYAPSIGLLKIGRSAEPLRRYAELRCMSPIELDLIGVVHGGSNLEANLHREFSELRRHGEWFEATPFLLDYVRAHCVLDLWEDMPAGLKEKLRGQLYPDVPVMDRGAA